MPPHAFSTHIMIQVHPQCFFALLFLFCYIIEHVYSLVLTPQLLLEAPRPSSSIVTNDAGNQAVISVSYPSTSSGLSTQTLYHVPLDPIRAWNEDPHIRVITHGAKEAIFLDDYRLALLINTTLCQRSIYDDDITSGCETPMLVFPAPVENLKKVSTSQTTATLVFSSRVYEDGDLNTVSKHDASPETAQWKRTQGT